MEKKKSVKEMKNKYSHNDRQDVVCFAEQNSKYTQKMLSEAMTWKKMTMEEPKQVSYKEVQTAFVDFITF